MGRRVLLVEDNADIRGMLAAMLRLAGHEVTPVGEALTAYDHAVGNPPDVVVTDLRMPGMDGLELVRLLREHAATRAVPILMVTAIPHDPRCDAVRAMPQTVVQAKPVLLRELADNVQRLTEGQGLQPAARTAAHQGRLAASS